MSGLREAVLNEVATATELDLYPVLQGLTRAATRAGLSTDEAAVQVALLELCGTMSRNVAIDKCISVAEKLVDELRAWRRSR